MDAGKLGFGPVGARGRRLAAGEVFGPQQFDEYLLAAASVAMLGIVAAAAAADFDPVGGAVADAGMRGVDEGLDQPGRVAVACLLIRPQAFVDLGQNM
jgi:hypothetical protein